MSEDVDLVAGAVVNGTPWHPIGTAGYLLEFSEWLPGRPDAPDHGAGCNLLLSRQAFDESGGFLAEVFGGEDTILTFGLARHGRMAFAPQARVRHLNWTAMDDFVRHQRLLGAGFVSLCNHVEFPRRAFARPLLAPLAVPLRLIALAMRLARSPRQAPAALAVFPSWWPGWWRGPVASSVDDVEAEVVRVLRATRWATAWRLPLTGYSPRSSSVLRPVTKACLLSAPG